MFHVYPYTNAHELNLDWIISKVKNIEEAEANTKQYSETAEEAKDVAVDAKDAAVDAKEAAEAIVADTDHQIAVLQARVDNIIPDGTQTEGNTELLDIRVAADGTIYDSAGNAVRGQVRTLQTELTKFEDRVTKTTDNLLMTKYLYKDKLINTSTGSSNMLDNVNYDTYYMVPVEESTTYVLQTSNTHAFILYYKTFASDFTVIASQAVTQADKKYITITTGEDVAYISISPRKISSIGTVIEWDDIMLSEGTEYAEYQSPEILSDNYAYKLQSEIDKLNKFEYQILSNSDCLYSWYKKIIDGDNLRILMLGDSTFAETYLNTDHPENKKAYYLQKMMNDALGAGRCTVVNHGVGSTNTGDLTGSDMSSHVTGEYPNGFMGAWITSNVDIVLVNYGINDYNHDSGSLTYDQRLQLFKDNYTEFFERLFGSTSIEGRAPLNRSLDDICVLLVVPNNVTDSEEHSKWIFDCRDVLYDLANTYNAALFDTLAYDKDHSFEGWSIGDYIHPNYYSNAFIMSEMKRIIIPDMI